MSVHSSLLGDWPHIWHTFMEGVTLYFCPELIEVVDIGGHMWIKSKWPKVKRKIIDNA